ncbi:unnamed protein product [Darwinula stevensoni]|uniref:Methyltransferase FkbM domain-containing protein n=1 Tax=Darwinula stevensoni TaxID=69355 RepID=A0A7R8XKF3_9CRUS|nr:unnamed protein product [Darwinula stevensoni]CAG0893087.1 unnamed protein product [Darwinula stevensoni]
MKPEDGKPEEVAKPDSVAKPEEAAKRRYDPHTTEHPHPSAGTQCSGSRRRRRASTMPPRPRLFPPSVLLCAASLVVAVPFVLVLTDFSSRFQCRPAGDTLDMIPPAFPGVQRPKRDADPSEGQMTKRIIVSLFPVESRSNKFFVEAGALDGRTISKTLYLEENLGWTGLLVEPNPHLFLKMTNQKRNAWLAPYCLSPSENVIHAVMEYPYDPNDPIASWGGGISRKGRVKGPVKNGTTIYSALVKCYPLHMLLDALGVRTVHFFSLDVEGLELQVLKTLPFQRIAFHVIEVEHIFNDEGKDSLKDFLLSLEYDLVKDEGGEFIFVNKTALASKD